MMSYGYWPQLGQAGSISMAQSSQQQPGSSSSVGQAHFWPTVSAAADLFGGGKTPAMTPSKPVGQCLTVILLSSSTGAVMSNLFSTVYFEQTKVLHL